MLVIAIGFSIGLSVIVAGIAFVNSGLVDGGGLLEELLLALTVIVALPAVTLSVWIARRGLDQRSFTSLGLELKAPAGRDMLVGFLIPAPLFALIFITQWGLGWLTIEGWGWAAGGFALTLLGVLLGLVGFFAVGFYEELLFRGYYLQNLRDGTGLAIALFLSSGGFCAGASGKFLILVRVKYRDLCRRLFPGVWMDPDQVAMASDWAPHWLEFLSGPDLRLCR